MNVHICSFCNVIDNFHNFVDSIMSLIDQINTCITEITHIRSDNQYLLLFYESRTRINVKIIDQIR